MASAGEVSVAFTAETSKFNAGLKQVQGGVKSISSELLSLESVATKAFAAFSVAGLASFAKAAFDAADAIGDAADRAGIAVESLSRLKFAAEQNDVSFESLTTGLKKFQNNLSEAASGGAEAAKVFASIGVSAQGIKALSLEDQLSTIADAFQGISDPADRVNVALSLFGRSGTDLIPLLAQGSDGIKELTQEADRLGITLTERTAKGIDEADKALKRMSATISGLTSKALGNIALGIEDVFGSPDKFKQLNSLVDERNRKLKEIRATTELLGKESGTFVGKELEVQLRQQQAELAAIEARMNAVNAGLLQASERANQLAQKAQTPQPPSALQEFTATGPDGQPLPDRSSGEKAAIEADQQVSALLDKIHETRIQNEQQLNERLLQQNLDFVNERVAADLEGQQRIAKGEEQLAQFRVQQTKAAEDAILAAKKGATNAAIGLLQSYAGKSKTAAKALVIINKARAIAQAIQNTAEAVTLQLGSGNPYTAFGRAAAAGALGAAQVGIIAATGYNELQQINANGGAPLGSSVNPVYTQTNDQGDQVYGASSQNAVQVIIANNVGFDDRVMSEIIDGIKDAVNDRDVVIIDKDSRQSKMIRGS